MQKDPIVIKQRTSDAATNVALDTIAIGKQALIFVNSKRSAEAAAERVAKQGREEETCKEIAEQILKALSKPTKQCKRLAYCVKRGSAFHHAGLASKQRHLIEDAFRAGHIKVIAATPTLCLAPETKVWSGEKEIPVRSLKKEHLHVLRGERVTRIRNMDCVAKQNALPLLKLSTVSGRAIEATPNHRFLVKRGNDKLLLELKDIEKTDRIATLGRLEIEEKNLTVNHFTKKYKPKKEIPIDEQIAHFIGLMLGDGYSGASIEKGKLVLKTKGCLVSKDGEIRRVAVEVSERLGLKHKTGENSFGVAQVWLSKTNWFREFLARCGVNQSTSKTIHPDIIRLPKKQAAALLRGYFDADGYVQEGRLIGVSSISRKLIRAVQKLLLRFNIPARIRERRGSFVQQGLKAYKTKKSFELTITHVKAMRKYHDHIGFSVKRKQQSLERLVQSQRHIHAVSCQNCGFELLSTLFDGRNAAQKKWGEQKKRVIQLLGERGELGSRQLSEELGFPPRKNENRLNAHYTLIKKRKKGSISRTEWYWSLNPAGEWVFHNIIRKKTSLNQALDRKECPLCRERLGKKLRKSWRDSDFEGDIFWDDIRHIVPVDVADVVYDVVLPKTPRNDHLFVAEGIFTHNSAGVDTPAFRTIIRDTKRFTGGGMTDIPVLEYHQMAGRSGRPDFQDEYGEAIVIAKKPGQEKHLREHYIEGEPEAIYSKVASMPVLRTYCLSLVATEFVKTRTELEAFFEDTFFAHQYGDARAIKSKITGTIESLKEWGFFEGAKQTDGFVSAGEMLDDDELKATPLGRRVSELYLDPYTAHNMIIGLKRSAKSRPDFFAVVQLISTALEMRPLLRLKTQDYADLEEAIEEGLELLTQTPSIYEPDYETFLASLKTAQLLQAWADERSEEDILESYGVRPGELRYRLERADWLLYATTELARLLKMHHLRTPLHNARTRLRHGVKEELLQLIRLPQIGRVRARKLARAGIKTFADVKSASLARLEELTGPTIAKRLHKKVGAEPTLKNQRLGEE